MSPGSSVMMRVMYEMRAGIEKTISDSQPLTIEEAKSDLELAKKAAIVGFLTFERDWNPIGHDDSILYEALRDIVMDF